jgi:CRISPR/Cas system-associated exonuclease Cas4 (RecB family)
MNISADLFAAFLKCPTKCWLRSAGEPASGNAYAEWVKSQTASHRLKETERLVSEIPKDEFVVYPSLENLKSAKWRLATGTAVQARMNSCVLESEIHAIFYEKQEKGQQ